MVVSGTKTIKVFRFTNVNEMRPKTTKQSTTAHSLRRNYYLSRPMLYLPISVVSWEHPAPKRNTAIKWTNSTTIGGILSRPTWMGTVPYMDFEFALSSFWALDADLEHIRWRIDSTTTIWKCWSIPIYNDNYQWNWGQDLEPWLQRSVGLSRNISVSV